MLTGVALIICACHLFFTGGDNPYTRESVGKYLSYLIIPASVTLILIIGGFVYSVLTKEKSGAAPQRRELEMLESYSKRFEVDALDVEIKQAVLKERGFRRTANIILYTASAVFAAFAIVYVLFIADYSSDDRTTDILKSLSVTLPVVVAALCAQIARELLCESSAGRERAQLLSAVKAGYNPSAPVSEPKENNTTNNIVKYTLLGVAILLVVLGVFNGGMSDVLEKAIKICTECIGLG